MYEIDTNGSSTKDGYKNTSIVAGGLISYNYKMEVKDDSNLSYKVFTFPFSNHVIKQKETYLVK